MCLLISARAASPSRLRRAVRTAWLSWAEASGQPGTAAKNSRGALRSVQTGLQDLQSPGIRGGHDGSSPGAATTPANDVCASKVSRMPCADSGDTRNPPTGFHLEEAFGLQREEALPYRRGADVELRG